MTRQGWTRASYKPGETIKLVGHPMKDGSKTSRSSTQSARTARLYHDIARRRTTSKRRPEVAASPARPDKGAALATPNTRMAFFEAFRTVRSQTGFWVHYFRLDVSTVLTLHTVGMAMLVGASVVVALRLLNVGGGCRWRSCCQYRIIWAGRHRLISGLVVRHGGGRSALDPFSISESEHRPASVGILMRRRLRSARRASEPAIGRGMAAASSPYGPSRSWRGG
jgi:hypothetical protein